MNIENLTILANFLDTVPTTQFGMEAFAVDEHGEKLDFVVQECATVACAVGWGPRAGIWDKEAKSWYDYGDRVFNLHPGSPSWIWCFGGAWVDVDDTPTGAAKRIRYLIENGAPPTDAWDQLKGRVPYMFAEAA
ncbi:hypothetical protein C3Y94_025900 [Rhizobium ruizarguesonis]|uniref:hypothetical protein n=1 Tax=Rhizobium ruizarguesonis TaxID=2081791 RepID=UPI00163ABC58|nr:hypothetical protein [Rhizobium ruizarguesonis]MBC2806588.1 hypothetical protein [Rhizobium ruizarguesonis]